MRSIDPVILLPADHALIPLDTPFGLCESNQKIFPKNTFSWRIRMPDIHIVYKAAKDYKSIPVSGVFGGINPQGMIHADLFIEKAGYPEETVMRVNEGTGETFELSRTPEQQPVVREFLVGMVMRPEVAKAIGQWLLHQVDQMERQMQPGGWKQ